MATEKTFLEWVEFHERKWGIEQYPGRPALRDLLSCSIVAMWRVGKRFMLSVHSKSDELNDLVTGLITGTIENPDGKTLYKIYFNREPIEFRIKIVSPKPDDSPATLHAPENDKRSPKPVRKLPVLPGRNVALLPGRKVVIARTKKR